MRSLECRRKPMRFPIASTTTVWGELMRFARKLRLNVPSLCHTFLKDGRNSRRPPRLLAFSCHGVTVTPLCRLHEYGTPHAQRKLLGNPKCRREVQAIAVWPLEKAIHGSVCATPNSVGITKPAGCAHDSESHQFPGFDNCMIGKNYDK